MSTLPFNLSPFCSSGKPELAQGGGPNAGKLDEALKAGREAMPESRAEEVIIGSGPLMALASAGRPSQQCGPQLPQRSGLFKAKIAKRPHKLAESWKQNVLESFCRQ